MLRLLLDPARARTAMILGPARARASSFAEERPHETCIWVAIVTFVLGFLVNALGSAILEMRHDPLVTSYRDSLDFTSAIVGDGVLLPMANAVIVWQLLRWRRLPRSREVVASVAFGAAGTLAVHVFQAANDLVNWTMPRPFVWTYLGYTHALFMWAEISLVAFFWSQAGHIARLDRRAAIRPPLFFVLLCLLVLLRLLLADYGYLP